MNMEAKEKTAEPADKAKTLSTSLPCSETHMPQLVHGMDVDFDQSFAQLAREPDQSDVAAVAAAPYDFMPTADLPFDL